MTPDMRERYHSAIHAALFGMRRYVRGAAKADLVSMLVFILHQYRMASITEGQASRATGLDRVTIRELADRMNESDDATEAANGARI